MPLLQPYTRSVTRIWLIPFFPQRAANRELPGTTSRFGDRRISSVYIYYHTVHRFVYLERAQFFTIPIPDRTAKNTFPMHLPSGRSTHIQGGPKMKLEKKSMSSSRFGNEQNNRAAKLHQECGFYVARS